MGYSVRANFAVKANNKEQLKEFLILHKNVNTLSSLLNGHDFYVDCYFKDMKELSLFREILRDNCSKLTETFVVDEFKREQAIF